MQEVNSIDCLGLQNLIHIISVRSFDFGHFVESTNQEDKMSMDSKTERKEGFDDYSVLDRLFLARSEMTRLRNIVSQLENRGMDAVMELDLEALNISRLKKKLDSLKNDFKFLHKVFHSIVLKVRDHCASYTLGQASFSALLLA